MAKSSDIPAFGPLQGVKVVSAGSVIAEPFAATLMAEFGANVVNVESTMAPDVVRMIPWGWQAEHRNERALALNIPSQGGREVLCRLVQWADIFMESSKGGTYAKWGITDEMLWDLNPKLVIVHVSGFGQWGVEEYVQRASYDAVGQAFSGYMFINGNPEPMYPTRAVPYTCDYMSALTACWSALAALHRAQTTGEGESVDIAQYEVMARMTLQYAPTYYNEGRQIMRNGNTDPGGPGYEVYKCQDGGYVFIGCGGGPLPRMLKVLGLDNDPLFPPGTRMVRWTDPNGPVLDKAIKDFCMAHTADEVDATLNAAQVPCSKVMTFEDQLKNPHYAARKVIVEWDDPATGKYKGVNILPHFKKHPGQIWRGSPTYGMDNEDVLEEMGFTPEEVKAFYEQKVILKG